MRLRVNELVNVDASLIHRRCWSYPHVYALEKAGIFGKSWLFLGHESQIRAPGDFVQAYLCETPILLSRGHEGAVYAIINSCTHRGLPVCRADHGNTKRFVCPCHNWSYSVEGDLVAIPQESEVQHWPDKRQLGLKRVESWRGLVFGSFDANIIPLTEYLGDMRFYLDAFFDRFPAGIEFIGAPHRWLINANWKLPVENQLRARMKGLTYGIYPNLSFLWSNTRSSLPTTPEEQRLLDNRQCRQWLWLLSEEIRYVIPSRVNVQVNKRDRGQEDMLSVDRELEGEDFMGCPLREEGYLLLMLRAECAYKINSWPESPPARTHRIIAISNCWRAMAKCCR